MDVYSPPPPDSKPKPGGGTPTPRDTPPRQRSSRDKFAKMQSSLSELLSMVAMGQSGLAIASGDSRHLVGAEVTAEFAPKLAEAWVDLARENKQVEVVLTRVLQGSAFGGVAVTTLAYLYSQAQVYNAIPATLPNPWVDIPVPESDEVAQHARAEFVDARDEVIITPPPSPDTDIPGSRPPPPAPGEEDASARAQAEATKEAVNERRKREGS